MNEPTDVQRFANLMFGEEKPPRDGQGRPRLFPEGVEQDAEGKNRVPYARASSLADAVDGDPTFLWKWKMRGAVKGVADRPDLAALIASETYTCGFAEDLEANRAAGRRIDKVIERAMDHAGVDMKADWGTAVHQLTEPGTLGVPTTEDLQEAQAKLEQLWQRLGVVHLATELFCASDETRSAGTFDHLSYVPKYGIVITDKKTSAKAKAGYDAQLGSYANSQVYDPETDQRTSIPDFIASLGWDPGLWNPSVGLIWWVRRGGPAQARFLDLDQGWETAKKAAWMVNVRWKMGVALDNTKILQKVADERRAALLEAIVNAEHPQTLLDMWTNPVQRAIWTPEHTEAAKRRKAELQQ